MDDQGTPASTPIYGGNQPASAFESDLLLPPGFFARPTTEGPDLAEARRWINEVRPKRQNHWPALALALIAQAEAGLSALAEAFDSVPDVFHDERISVEESLGSKVVNTLNFIVPGDETVMLRGRYNASLDVIRNRMRRWGHPMNPGHATQSWPIYKPLITIIWRMTPGERRTLAEWIWDNGVLPLHETQHVSEVDRPVRRFERVLAEMPTQSGTHGGALWQAVCFGYLRADSPSLVLESIKAQTGSRHAGLAGDIDGYDGASLMLAVECKDKTLEVDDWESELGDFMATVDPIPGVTGVVMAADASDEARSQILDAGLIVLTRAQMTM